MRSIQVLLLILSLFANLAGWSQTPKQPNVILILADDMGWGDVRSHGNPVIETPHLDKLAGQGARFERFFVSPLCAPTRASLLTGRYHLRTGVASVTSGLETMRSNEVTLAEVFKKAGYQTGLFGKWHNGAHYPEDPNGQGFDEFFGFCGGHWVGYFDTKLQHNTKLVPTKGYITDVLTDAALGFLETQKDRPFFCYIPYNAPHGPFQVPDRYFEKYKARGQDNRDAAILGMVDNMDENIGRILKKLDDLKLADNTIVVFLTDNGPNGNRFNGGMNGTKGSVHEGGSRVPLFVRWPRKIRPNTVIKPITAHIDLLPTLVELTGVPMPQTLPLDGMSVAPLLRKPSTKWPDRTLFTHVHKSGSSTRVMPFPGTLRTPKYRFIRGKEADELYDLTADPGEKTDLATQQSALLTRFRQQYDDWFADVTKAGIRPEITQIGYPQAPDVNLYAPDATPLGSLKYYGTNGWAHDWFTGFQTPEQAAVWTVEVVEAGTYAVALSYNCPAGFVGNQLQVEVAGQTRTVPVSSSFVGTFYPRADRIVRNETFEKDWATLATGTFDLPKGIHKLTVRGVGTVSVPLELKAVRVSRKRGWDYGVQAFTFKQYSFLEAIDKADSSGVQFIESFPRQKIGEGDDSLMTFRMNSQSRAKIRERLRQRNIQYGSYGAGKPANEAEWIAAFEFCKEMGIPTIVSEPQESEIPMLSALCDRYQINLAIHNHAKPSHYWHPDTVLRAIAGYSKRLGACADIGHWVRSGLDPVECLRKLDGRVIELHMKDLTEKGVRAAHDVLWGTGVCNLSGVIAELERQQFRGVVIAEYEYNWANNVPDVRTSVVNFKQMTANHPGK
jgi:arylsulfatase A-like enzyme/sugar phosphate isomerase/epimerase